MKKRLTALFLILPFLFSCTTSSDRSRGSLSDAMDRSRDDYEKERTVPDEEDPWWEEDDETPSYEEPEAPAAVPDDDEPSAGSDSSFASAMGEDSKLTFLIRGGSSGTGGPYYVPRFNMDVLIGDSFDNWSVYLYGGFRRLKVRSDHDLFQSVKEYSFSLNAGLEGRFHPFPDWTFFSPYLSARMGGLYLFWTYKNPLIAGSDEIRSDVLGGLAVGTGIGADIYRGDEFRLGLSILPEAYLFGEETQEGFDNDFFSSQWFVRWSLEGGYRF